ncbi:hypothetical protein HHX47_DHR2000960 [Lentinula edodes]|nr:hypothetical protein HHX47_DHR2000960 [Lentinula edodes]
MAKVSDHISIAIMGGTGTGKTTFTNLISDSGFKIGNGLESCTKHIQTIDFTFNNHIVTLIDVPGFDDTNKSDADILKMIADFLASEYKAGRRLSGIMYLHRISDVRMGGASKRNFAMFEKLCGQDAFSNVAIVTTRWDQEEEAVAKARLEELKTKPQLYKPVLDGGGAIFRHERTRDSANAILSHLVAKTATSLLIQREMVEESKGISETAAGKELQQEILRQVEKHQQEMDELLEELKNNRETSEFEELEAECEALQEQATHWQEEARKLAETSTPIKPDLLNESSPQPLFDTTVTHSVLPSARDDDGFFGASINGKAPNLCDSDRRGARAKLEVAVKYLLDAITTVLHTADSLRREVTASTGSRNYSK